MAVVSCDFLKRSFGTSVSNDGRFEATYTHVYKLVVDDPDTPEDEILDADGLPSLFDAYDNDVSARLKSKDPSLFSDDSRLVYLVTCVWSTLTPPESQEQHPENPFDVPVKRSTSTVFKAFNPTRDRDGNAILNFIGEAFDPPIQDVKVIDQVTFVRNVPHYSLSTGRRYKNKVNSVAIVDEAPGTVLCVDLVAEEHRNSDPPYWTETWTFQIDPDGRQPKVLEASYIVQIPPGDIFVRAKDDNNQDTPLPVPINENGEQIPRDQLPDAAIHRTWNVKHEIDFLETGLPFE